jgi:Domain of unknown function (DUF4034)
MSILNRAQCVFLVSLLLSTCSPTPAQNTDSNANTADDDETVLHEGKWIHSIQSSLIEEKFDDLDRMADQYRRDKSRLPGGDWRLHVFYSALDAPQLSDQGTQDHLAHLEHWTQQRPSSITARIALATSLSRWAWVARGNGYASTVSADGWRLFNERIKQSQTVLEAAAHMSPMCPQWYSEMMTVGLALNWDAARMKETFDQGVQSEPGYFYLYRQYANYLLPKWDGHPGDSSAFAKSSADSLSGNAGDTLYFQIATVLIRHGDDSFPIHEMNWDRIQHGYQALSTQYGTSRRTMNQLAFMAYKFKDASVARQQFAAIGDKWSRGVWRNRQLFDRARDWSMAQDPSD